MFKVGDVVTGKNDDDYYVTTSRAKLVVVSISGGSGMMVQVLSHKDEHMRHYLGEAYHVSQLDFVKVSKFKGNK